MIENPNYLGHFKVFDVSDEVLDYMRTNRTTSPLDLVAGGYFVHEGVALEAEFDNIIMASAKLAMANAVFPTIDRLVITNQTTIPQDNETSYSGAIYTTISNDELDRSANTNPYRITWSITGNNANGVWGSVILINSAGEMINRALSGVTKQANTNKIVQFTGSVV